MLRVLTTISGVFGAKMSICHGLERGVFKINQNWIIYMPLIVATLFRCNAKVNARTLPRPISFFCSCEDSCTNCHQLVAIKVEGADITLLNAIWYETANNDNVNISPI